MKRIYWMSRHEPLPAQLRELERLFGQVEVVQDPKPFSSADDIVERFRLSGADDMLIVAPLSVIAAIVQRGVRPLWAEMKQVFDPAEADTEANGRLYRFVRFRRIKDVRIEFDEEWETFASR